MSLISGPLEEIVEHMMGTFLSSVFVSRSVFSSDDGDLTKDARTSHVVSLLLQGSENLFD